MNSPPARLYKYLASARIDIVDNWLIRFTQPGALNDPFELRPHVKSYGTPEEVFNVAAKRWEGHAEEQYAALVHAHGERMTFAEFRARIELTRKPMIDYAIESQAENINAEMSRKLNELMNESIGILSLCECPDDLLMWAHYGDSHKGFVLEFDSASPFFYQPNPPAHVRATDEEAAQYAEEYGRLRPVVYSEDRPSVIISQLKFDVLLTKGLSWEYEAEWRMLMPPMYANKQMPPVGPYSVCLFAIPPSAVTKIVLGCNADDVLVAHAMTLRDRPETTHIAIEKARIGAEHYKLHFDPV